MIDAIDLSRLTNAEYGQFTGDFLAIVAAKTASAQVKEQYDNLNAVNLSINDIFKIPTGSAITAQLEKLDLERDNALVGYRLVLRGLSYSSDSVVKTNAEILLAHLNLFGTKLTELSYPAETMALTNILDDLAKKKELSAALTALNLTTWRDTLQTANNNFTSAYVKRSKETGMANAESLKGLRLQGNDAYYKLRNRLNALEELSNGDSLYIDLNKELNGSIKFYNDVIARRGSAAPVDDTATAPQA